MPSVAHNKFALQISGARVLQSFYNQTSSASNDALAVEQMCLLATVAQAVGCWEGYIEAVVREFVSKTRIVAHRRSWPLIVQFEMLTDKLASDLNTPSWEKARDLFILITGADPHSAWTWTPKFTNSTDTKIFYDGVMKVRHSFAHGFSVPLDTPGLTAPGKLDLGYSTDVISCIEFFANSTDNLLERELQLRHGCPNGWS